MIVDALLGVLEGILTLVGGLLPSIEAVPWADEVDDVLEAFEGFGFAAGPLDHWIPLHELLNVMDFLLTIWLPVQVVYVTIRWVYAHTPAVGKG